MIFNLNLKPLNKISKEKAKKLSEKINTIKIPTKMVIVMRSDLNMRKGKASVQASHGAVNAVLQCLFSTLSEKDFKKNDTKYILPKATCEDNFKDWINGNFTKICVSVNSESELDDIYNKAKILGLNAVEVIDKGFTEFHGVPTKTCVVIGPDYYNRIDELTKNLKLL